MSKFSAFPIIIFSVIFLATGYTASENSFQQISVPDPVVPVYKKLKDLHITTSVVSGSKASAAIVTPEIYLKEAQEIQKTIKNITGVKIPVILHNTASLSMDGNLILLGNRSTNKLINSLYDQAYTFLDLKYPGKGGYVVRSLHNPLGNGKNFLFAGGSDTEGVKSAVAGLIKEFKPAEGKKKSADLSVGYICNIKLGCTFILPENITKAEIWEASEMYRSSGYFGWNMVSKNMALYYMTGKEEYRKEFMRLAFPDKAAIKEIEDYDGERIENKNDPLAGPYHYSAHMMIELWDLIEESTAFTGEERLKITNAFARQLPHRVIEGVYNQVSKPESVGGRHGDWSAFSLYVLGRYFQKDYPDPIWKHCMNAAGLYFSALKNTYWTGGTNDHLFWFTSYYDPMINYLVITENRDNDILSNLRRSLNTQEIISTGLKEDWGVRASSLSMLNRAAYLLDDGKWLYYREKINLDTDSFRLGQSFWPSPELPVRAPDDVSGKWNVQIMPAAMYKSRQTKFTPSQSFRWGSYRSGLKPDDDFILIKGYNGAGRNPYHTYDILELRLNGKTLLKGYGNQVLSGADGMVEPKVAMDAALLHYNVFPEFVSAVAEVPDLPFMNWKRSLVLKNKQFVVIADEMKFRTNSNNMLTETQWEMPGGAWDPELKCIRVKQEGNYELHSSDQFSVSGRNVISMKWKSPVKNGDNRTFFHVLGSSSPDNPVSSLRLSSNAAFIATPEKMIAVTGEFEGLKGDLVLLSSTMLYGHNLQEYNAGQQIFSSDKPADVEWNFEKGTLHISSLDGVKLTLPSSDRKLLINGKQISGTTSNSLFTFDVPPGRHDITGAILPPEILAFINEKIEDSRLKASSIRAEDKSLKISSPPSAGAQLKTVMQTKTVTNPAESIVFNESGKDLLCVASGRTISIFSPEGTEIRKIETEGDVRVLRWWEEPKLLLAGCADEKVIAFNLQGEKIWEFTSVMDQAVYEAGKQYWFKSAHPGIYGLYSGDFDNGKSRAFVGSACTLEVLDEQGKLVKRLPTFWGPGRQFLIVDAENGSKNLLVGRWHNDRESMIIVNSKKLEETGRGYFSVPEGHSYINGWDAMNRSDNYLLDLDGNGTREVVSAINGTWNRISVYSENGKSLYNAQIGPGLKEPRANIKMMDAGDINNDGKCEIIFSLASGFINALDHTASKLWSIETPGVPSLTRIINDGKNKPWICAGCSDGTILALDENGNITNSTRIDGEPVFIQVMNSEYGSLVVIITRNGDIYGFRR